MKKVIGKVILASVFIGVFVLVALNSSPLIALKTFGSAVVITALISAGTYLLVSED